MTLSSTPTRVPDMTKGMKVMELDHGATTGSVGNGRSRVTGLLLAGALGASLALIPAAASAGTDDGPADINPPAAETLPPDEHAFTACGLDLGESELVFFDEDPPSHWQEDWRPRAEEIAEISAVEDKLAAHLDSLGIDYQRVEEDGVSFVEVDWEDEAAAEAVDAFYLEHFPFDLAMVDEINADVDEIIAALQEAGIPITVMTEGGGLKIVEIDSEDEATIERADEILAELFGEFEHGAPEDAESSTGG